MDVWRWTQALSVLAIGWAVIALAMRLFHTPLRHLNGPVTQAYWIARAFVWACLLICGISGTSFVISCASSSPGPIEFGTLFVSFFGNAIFWMYIALYAVYCYGFGKCFG